MGISHGFAVITLSALVGLPYFDSARLELLWFSYMQQGYSPDWVSLALHLGLAACLWALMVIGYMLVAQRRKTTKKVVKLTRGSVMVETLIVIVPFLLLTSGLAQLVMLNITGLLADLAVFQSARVAWVWHPELQSNRGVTAYKVKDRARAMASMVLAPTAPNDYKVGREIPPGSTNDFRRQRSGVTAAFMHDGATGLEAYSFSGGYAALQAGGAFGLDVEEATPENLSFYKSFDISSFQHRAARKMTFAEWGLWDNFTILSSGGRTGVEFTYKYNLIFPWFGYIWGEPNEVGMREGYYSAIRRRHTFASQPSMN